MEITNWIVGKLKYTGFEKSDALDIGRVQLTPRFDPKPTSDVSLFPTGVAKAGAELRKLLLFFSLMS